MPIPLIQITGFFIPESDFTFFPDVFSVCSSLAFFSSVESGFSVSTASGVGVASSVGVASGVGVAFSVGVASGVGVAFGVGVASGVGVTASVGVGVTSSAAAGTFPDVPVASGRFSAAGAFSVA